MYVILIWFQPNYHPPLLNEQMGKNFYLRPTYVSRLFGSQDIVVWNESFFLIFRGWEATLLPFVMVPLYEKEAFLTNLVTPRPNGNLFEHEKRFWTYLTYIQDFTKTTRFSTYRFFKGMYAFAQGWGRSATPPLGLMGLSKWLSISWKTLAPSKAWCADNRLKCCKRHNAVL